MEYNSIINTYTYEGVNDRYINNDSLTDFLDNLNLYFKVDVVGKSVENLDIKTVSWGVGSTKVFMWSQMHGNESTTTKAVVDFLNLLNTCQEDWVKDWYSYFTFLIVPILNPDGAKYYTRVNANQVDLNRDSIDLTQPESRILRKLFDEFKPEYAFNLHDQRTIFGVEGFELPATISFLAPSYNEEREVNANREEAMKLIAAINNEVQKIIPNQVGRFDDSFNINCIGDYFQSRGAVTILFEAGHYQGDYKRDETRKVVFRSLLKVLKTIKERTYNDFTIENYFSIPNNVKSFNDVALLHVFMPDRSEEFIVNIQYLEQLKGNKVNFSPIIVDINKKQSKFVHLSINNNFFFKKYWKDKDEVLDRNLEDIVEITAEEIEFLLKK